MFNIRKLLPFLCMLPFMGRFSVKQETAPTVTRYSVPRCSFQRYGGSHGSKRNRAARRSKA